MKRQLLKLLPLALLTACGGGEKQAVVAQPVLVRSVGTAGAGLDAYSGEIRARQEADLAFRIGGKIVAREVELGTRVQRGQRLARLDPEDSALQAKIAADQRSLAEAELRRYRDLRERNFISQAQLDAKETAFRNADAQARWSGNQSAYAMLTADRDGVITAVHAEPGQVVAPGQAVLRLAATDELEVAISVPEGSIARIRVGDPASVGLWAGDERRQAGRVREIAPAADPVTRTFAVRIALPGRDPALRLGMTANVLLSGSDGNLLSVPLASVVGRDTAPGGNKAAVWVVDPATQTVAPHPVQVARYGEDTAFIRSGLKAGEQIVAAGAYRLRAGQKVRPLPAR